jgi:hypothetical protein
MTTEAQVRANRSNAEKSTGPRTAEGKATAAQNSLKHGLFAREGVIRGEDREEYEMHREMLLEQLSPVGPLEVILATRVVDLSWRLRRAGQDHNEAFGALYDRHTAQAGEPQGPEERGAVLGRMILEDFEQEAVLERLLRYERRIECSFYRTLKELRHVHDQGRKADREVAGTLQRWREEDGEARKARAFACEPPWGGWPAPAGGTTNTARAEVAHPSGIPSAPFTHPVADPLPEDETCKTNPISPGGMRPAGRETPEWAPAPHDSTIPSFQYSNPAPAAPDEMCKTNPISPDLEEGRTGWGEEVGRDSHRNGHGEAG